MEVLLPDQRLYELPVEELPGWYPYALANSTRWVPSPKSMARNLSSGVLPS